MKYSSIREYFYKMHSLLYAIILLPLLMFVMLYWLMNEGKLEGQFYANDEMKQWLLLVFSGVVFLDWIAAVIVFNRGINATRKIVSLGERLDKYYRYTLIRFLVVMMGALLLAAGFYLTEDQRFTLVGGVSIVLVLVFWPFPAKVCKDLQLKGDERTLVLYKKDKL
jgi:cytochrome c oxidase subunit IV